MHRGVWWGDLKVKRPMKDVGAGGRITSKWFLKNWNGRTWTRFICFSDERGREGGGGL